MNCMSPVETGDGPGPNPGIGNARGVKEGIGEKLAVGNHPHRL